MGMQFVYRPAGIDEILAGRRTEAFFADVADALEHEAKAIARTDAYLTGSYHDKIEGVTFRHLSGRWGARLNANSSKSHWIEWGNVHQQPRAVLRRAVERTMRDFQVSRKGQRRGSP